jgi:hypothetical protein
MSVNVTNQCEFDRKALDLNDLSTSCAAANAKTFWTPSDIEKHSGPHSPLRLLLDWVYQYIAKPHGRLGRPGAVCPFVPAALNFQSLWISIVDPAPRHEHEMCECLKAYLKLYQLLKPTNEEGRDLRTLVVAFPTLAQSNTPAFMDKVHAAVKPLLVNVGLMLGEFYSESRSPGLHNPDFFPLRSPVPLFVYRQMVPGDLMFLNKASDPPEKRIQFIQSYINALGPKLSADWLTQAHKAIAASEEELLLSQCNR